MGSSYISYQIDHVPSNSETISGSPASDGTLTLVAASPAGEIAYLRGERTRLLRVIERRDSEVAGLRSQLDQALFWLREHKRQEQDYQRRLARPQAVVA